MENKLSALVVDDEKIALDLLSRLLEEFGLFREIRLAASAADAATVLKQFSPDLIFLDIRMPGCDGLSFLRDLDKEQLDAGVIFVTAYDQYALQALKLHAFDYLLKPVNREELAHCLNQYLQQRKTARWNERLESLLEMLAGRTKIRLNTRIGYVLIDPAKILYCQAEGNYTEIHMGTNKHMCSISLNKVQQILPQNGFKRIGRSYIINTEYITRVNRKNGLVTLEKDNQMYDVKLSRRAINELEKN